MNKIKELINPPASLSRGLLLIHYVLFNISYMYYFCM